MRNKDDNAESRGVLLPGYKRRVSYFYDGDVGNYYYGPGHPMKPFRVKLAHNLISSYNLFRYMDFYQPALATAEALKIYHDKEYINFLKRVTVSPEIHESKEQMLRFNVGESTDCPIFPGLFDYCANHAGCSIDAAIKLNHNETDIAINWSGGMHHAKKCEASGFCYINDIVLGIVELLKYHPRVLYIDIDIHHGDGVEEAFYCCDRVMTLSFHRYGDFFFPETGNIDDIGHEDGRYYSVNFPLEEGMDDRSYEQIFKPVVAKAIEVYRPSVIVLQCGADSLIGDRLGVFNLSVKGHAECVKFVKSYNIPLMILGGGGYTVRNVARCWAYETAVLLNQKISDDIPYHKYYETYCDNYSIHIPAPQYETENRNTTKSLEKLKIKVLSQIGYLIGAPSVQFQEIPPDFLIAEKYKEEEEDPDERIQYSPTKSGAIKKWCDDSDSDYEFNPLTGK